LRIFSPATAKPFWNREGRNRGGGDSPLTRAGVEQPQDAFYLLEGGEIVKIDAGD